jgi:hypothetical protein
MGIVGVAMPARGVPKFVGKELATLTKCHEEYWIDVNEFQTGFRFFSEGRSQLDVVGRVLKKQLT